MLPAQLKAAFDLRLEGVSRIELARRAQRISALYRDGESSAAAIRDQMDALAYAISRFPATYAAVAHALAHAMPHLPDLAPKSVLDLGAGPGSATFAALGMWPGIAAIRQVEASPVFRAFASDVLARCGHACEVTSGDLARPLEVAIPADLVIASYVLVELPEDAVARLVVSALAEASGMLLLVEPGTPKGFERIRLARQALIAAGAAIVAPCPGNGSCPMIGGDWCHFSVRLARSRDHMILKDAEVPFEDERFAYMAATRSNSVLPATARILREPDAGRGDVELTFCTADGPRNAARSVQVQRRDNARFKAARKIKWGDAYEP